jgi:hypothetical protein
MASVRSRAPLASPSGAGLSAGRFATEEPKPLRRVAAEGPDREAKQSFAGRPVPAPDTGSTIDGRTRGRDPAPPRRRPPAEVSRARGRMSRSCIRRVHRAACAGDGSLLPGPCGPPGGRATPTRSTRTPLVVRPWPRRLERPALPASLRSGSDAVDDPTARAPPPRRVGARGPSTTRLREAAGGALQCSSCDGHEAPPLGTCRLRGHIRGQGRIPRASAKKREICRTRGAFDR